MSLDKILIIDDCRITTLLLRHILIKINVNSDSAPTGEAGVDLAIANEYPLVFIDVMLPGIDGFEVCRRLRKCQFERRPRLILVTNMGEHFPHSLVSEVGADGHFFKPVVPSQIASVVQETLSQTEESSTSKQKEETTG
jgi:twitching motility two-component system response regulator PilG